MELDLSSGASCAVAAERLLQHGVAMAMDVDVTKPLQSRVKKAGERGRMNLPSKSAGGRLGNKAAILPTEGFDRKIARWRAETS